MLVRGKDDYGNFELIDPPQTDALPLPGQTPKAVERMMKSVMPTGRQPTSGN
jgi:hypothetical protein